MTVIACGECNQPVSTAAKACPGCGAGRRDFSRRPGQAWRLSWPRAAIIALVACGSIGAIISISTPPAQKTPADEIADTRAQRAYQAARALKSRLREPDSLVFESIRADERGDTICIRYRARNGLGGMTHERLTLRAGAGNSSAQVWNRNCAGRTMYDLTVIGRSVG